jgi:hypothetical protein
MRSTAVNAHHSGSRTRRWASLRSAHPTLAKAEKGRPANDAARSTQFGPTLAAEAAVAAHGLPATSCPANEDFCIAAAAPLMELGFFDADF